MRLDEQLVKRKFFETRTKAKDAIKDGIVFVNGVKENKPGKDIKDTDLVELIGNKMPYVSKGGLKLEHAIKTFNISLENKILLDIGSSTGGFTDCALQNKIKEVVCVDVGTEQLHQSLKENNKITLYENTDIRNIDSALVDKCNIVSIDISFISISKIIDKLKELKNINEIICLIKPQFECGKEIADKYKGIIRDKNIHNEIINKIKKEFKKAYFNCIGVTTSPIKGGSGNIEYLGYFKKS